MTVDSSAWVRRFHTAPDSEAVRLAVLPHAGGSASYFRLFSQALHPHVETLAVQYPGRQDRSHEERIEEVTVLADRVAEALAPWTDRPLALFGHSMGASVAFEVTRRLERRGVAPLALFVSGRSAPAAQRPSGLHLLDDDALIAEIGKLSGTDTRVLASEEMLRLVLPAVRSDYKAVETYVCAEGARVASPVVALVGRTDPRASVDGAQGWAAHTTGRFALHDFEGGHFYLAEQWERVAELVRGVLRDAPRTARR
ncbi:thioesterase II family protein [Streptomyces daliensis]